MYLNAISTSQKNPNALKSGADGASQRNSSAPRSGRRADVPGAGGTGHSGRDQVGYSYDYAKGEFNKVQQLQGASSKG